MSNPTVVHEGGHVSGWSLEEKREYFGLWGNCETPTEVELSVKYEDPACAAWASARIIEALKLPIWKPLEESEDGSHLCVGPSCWECGEPTELRDMRWAIRAALLNENTEGLDMSHCAALARIAARAIREDVLAMMTKIIELQDNLRYSRQDLADLEEIHRTADVWED
jgi:hypothetical protein